MAIRDITLEANRGKWLTIIGPSGSGKTTLLNLMCGLYLPSQGQIFFQNRQLRSDAEWTSLREHHIDFVFPTFNRLPTLTALENVQVPICGVSKSAEIRSQRARELLRQVALARRTYHLPRACFSFLDREGNHPETVKEGI
jgi:putative ABC transport system ATP-binding protein